MRVMNAKQAVAAKMLEHADMYLMGDREVYDLAHELLRDAARFVRCGFRMPDWKQFYDIDNPASPFLGRRK